MASRAILGAIERIEPKAAAWLEHTAGQKFLLPGATALRRLGPSGGFLADLLLGFRDKSEQRAAGMMTDYTKNVGQFMDDPVRWGQFVNQLDKGIPAADPVVNRAATLESFRNEAILGESISKGLTDPRWRVKYYFPHKWPETMFEGRNRNNAINYFIGTGQARDYAHAARIIDNFIGPRPRRAYNLESPRKFNLPGYRTDYAVLADHYTDAARRLTAVESLGKNEEVLTALLSQVRKESGESGYKFAKLTTDVFLGRHPGMAISPLERKLNSLEAATKLSTAVIGNVTQPMNTILLGGVGPFVRTVKSMIQDYGSAAEFGLRSGAPFHQALQEIRRVAGVESETLGGRVLRYTGFSPIERFNRIFSSNVGKHFAEEEFAALRANASDARAKANLRLLGIDVEAVLKRGTLSDGDRLMAGKRVSDLTQFRSTTLELPVMWKAEPHLRLLTLYKQFAYNQSRFLYNFVFKPAMRGELRPLLYFSLIFPAIGEVAADVKTLVRKGPQGLKDRPDYPIERILDNISQVGSLGIMSDVIYGISSPAPDAFARFVLGPVFGDAFWDIPAIAKASEPEEETARFFLRRTPVVGPLAQEQLVPREKKYQGPLQRGEITKWLRRQKGRLEQLEKRQ